MSEIGGADHDAAILLVRGAMNDWYYLISKLSNGRFVVDLKINLAGDIYTVQASGKGRDGLEAFAVAVVKLNVDAKLKPNF